MECVQHYEWDVQFFEANRDSGCENKYNFPHCCTNRLEGLSGTQFAISHLLSKKLRIDKQISVFITKHAMYSVMQCFLDAAV